MSQKEYRSKGLIAKLSLGRPAITLRDLVKPELNSREQRAFWSALKGAKRDQDTLLKLARKK